MNKPATKFCADPNETKLVYIVGCGRSGSTALGFCLGSGDRALDLGEVNRLARQRGIPKGYGEGTETYQFWAAVVSRLESDARWPGMDTVARYERRFDTHLAFLLIYLFRPILWPFGLKVYEQALQALYETLISSSDWRALIDGSKYPSRLLHLTRVVDKSRLRVVFLVRDPANLCASFRTEGQDKVRGSAFTLSYYFVNNLFSLLAVRMLPKCCVCRLRYEDFTSNPSVELRRVGDQIGLEVESIVSLIESESPLRKGFLMNGNRMRKQPQVTFKRSPPRRAPLSGFAGLVAAVLRRMYFHDQGNVKRQ